MNKNNTNNARGGGTRERERERERGEKDEGIYPCLSLCMLVLVKHTCMRIVRVIVCSTRGGSQEARKCKLTKAVISEGDEKRLSSKKESYSVMVQLTQNNGEGATSCMR